jgi:hypothetical protein
LQELSAVNLGQIHKLSRESIRMKTLHTSKKINLLYVLIGKPELLAAKKKPL